MLTISSGICSSSHGEMILSSSRALILDTTFFRSSTIAEARGSIVLMTQLHDVCNFSANLDISAAVISTGIKVLMSRTIYCHIVVKSIHLDMQGLTR